MCATINKILKTETEGICMLQEIAASNAVALPMDLAQGRQQAAIPMAAWWSQLAIREA